MDTRRRVIATAATAVVAALAGCATGGDETEVDDATSAAGTTIGATTTSRTTTEEATTTERSTTTDSTTERPTTTEQPTTTQQSTTTEQPTTTQQSTTTEQPTTTERSTTTEQPTTTQQSTVVTVGPSGELVFDPDSLTIPVGSVVEFRWDSNGHNVVAEDQPSDANWSGTSGGPGTTYDAGHVHAHTFEVAGRYEYYCAPHEGLGMDGTIVVE